VIDYSQAAGKEIPRDPSTCLDDKTPSAAHQVRAPCDTAKVNHPRSCVARRDRRRHGNGRRDFSPHKYSVRYVSMTASMAFIAPGLVKAAVEGGSLAASALPSGVTLQPNGRSSSSGSV
jgi:hypothetical protein